MGKVEWRGGDYAAKLHDALDDRLSAFAELIEDDARARAPIRQVEPGRKRGRLSSFTPGVANQIYRFGRVTLSGSDKKDYYSILGAASRLGIPLFLSASRRRQMGLGELQVRERRPRRRVKREVLSARAASRPLPGVERAPVSAQQEEFARRYHEKRYGMSTAQFEARRSAKRAPGSAAFIAKIRRIAGETVDTRPGRLRRSIISEGTSEGTTIKYTVRAEAPYARYVEFPTSRTAAQPFLLPALKNARKRLKPWLKGRAR